MPTEQQTVSAGSTFPTFADLIAPMSLDEFLGVYWQAKPCFIHGSQTKYQDLFSWHDLSALLENHHFAYPRFRMTKAGTEVPPHQYLEMLPFTKGNRIDNIGLQREFARASTLIVQHADEYCPQLRSLACVLSSALEWHTEVEVIAGSGSSNGLPCHCDSNDCLVFHLAGAKRWRFYQPTRRDPLRKSKMFPGRYDVFPSQKPRTEQAPFMQAEVRAGDFVYVPRGWWHLVDPLPGACLSLNPTVYGATFQDFLRWLVDELSAADPCRASIPNERNAQQFTLARLGSYISDLLTIENVRNYRVFLANEMERPTTAINLPGDDGRQKGFSLQHNIRLQNGIPLHVNQDDSCSEFRVRWKRQDLHFARDDMKLFLALNDGKYHLVADLLSNETNEESKILRMAFLSRLWQQGVITS